MLWAELGLIRQLYIAEIVDYYDFLNSLHVHIFMQLMDNFDDQATNMLYMKGGSNYSTISSLAWRFVRIYNYTDTIWFDVCVCT